MKNLIVNIYKTLFFFDLAIVVAYYIPDIKTNNPALLTLWREGVYIAVMIAFTLFFIRKVEKNRIRVFNLKNKLRHYSLGLITGAVPLAVTALPLWIFKSLRFNGANKISGMVFWLIALLLEAAANELLLRGYLFRLYRKYYSLPVVTAVITFLFVSLNINVFSHGVIYALNMLLTNIILCLLAEYSYSLLAPITARFFYNLISGFLLGSLTVSEEYPAVINTLWSGNKYIAGGDMRLEGSLILLAANIAVCVFFIKRLKERKNIT
ncbi:MAG: CPBP family intramembrane glutamic endopeptidase [Acutalibacteraceae bacterium]|nr:CPBP family intramembrane glutamic endopeptidase [Acutalibacteraceae bacterium]